MMDARHLELFMDVWEMNEPFRFDWENDGTVIVANVP